MNAQHLEPYATLDAAGIPRGVLGPAFAAACEKLQDSAPATATEADIIRKAGFYIDDRGTLEWEDTDMCELTIEASGFTAADFTPAAKRVAMRRELAAQVQSYRALALMDQTQWVDALDGLNGGQKLAIIHAVMSGDHCEVGRRLRDMLQPAVLEAATDRAREAFDARHDGSSDVVAVLDPQAVTP